MRMEEKLQTIYDVLYEDLLTSREIMLRSNELLDEKDKLKSGENIRCLKLLENEGLIKNTYVELEGSYGYFLYHR